MMAIDIENSQQQQGTLFNNTASSSANHSYVNVREGTRQATRIVKTMNKTMDSEGPDELSRPSTSASSRSDVRMRKLQRVGTALWDYQARENDELSLRPGSLVKIVSEECGEDGWMIAQIDNKKGMVPKNYVVLVGIQPSIISADDVKRTPKLLGSGGFADVYLGYYKGQDVALKVSRSDQDKEALVREALILSRMNHKNIVGFFGLSLNPHFIVLELCEGKTLFNLGRQMISSDVLTVIGWSRQVGEALQYLHSQDVSLVYADLKAENVLIKELPCVCGLSDDSWQKISNYTRANICRKCNGTRIDMLTLKLADFNVTRRIDVKRDSCTGSILWMSPEVITDKNFSKSSDVWSFGIFLWEIFSRKIPFKNCEINTIMHAILIKTETLPLPINLPYELRIIFEECWRKLPDERPSISEVLMHLQTAEDNVDSKFKWELKEEQFIEERHDENDVLENIENDSHKITIPLEVFMCMERLGGDSKLRGMIKKLVGFNNTPTPAKRLKKNKLDKGSIGLPIDFRHNVSAQLQNTSPTIGIKTSSNDKLIVIRCLGYEDKEEEMVTKPQHHRSHDSLLDQNKDDKCSAIYSTLPRHRQKAKSQCQEMTDCSKLDFNEDNRKNGTRLGRHRHDYLKLSPCPCVCQKQQHIIHKRIKHTRMNTPLKVTTVENKFERQMEERADFNEFDETSTDIQTAERKLNRSNAVRPKINESKQKSELNHSSSSPSLEGFVVVGGSGCEDIHNSHETTNKSVELPDLFSRKLSPPQQQHSSAPCSSRLSTQNDIISNINGKVKRSRKPSNEQIPNSTFYLNRLDECSDSPPISTDRRSSGRLGWVKTFFGTSPRQSTSVEEFVIGEQSAFSDKVITPAECFHPHHRKEKDEHQYTHLCALCPATKLLPLIWLTSAPQLPKTPLLITGTYTKRFVPQERQRQCVEATKHIFLPGNRRAVAISPTGNGNESKDRFSLNTMIRMKQINNNQISDKPFQNFTQMPNPARSCTDLHAQAILHQQHPLIQNSALLTPDKIETTFHQRSRSSENPISTLQQRSSPNNLIQILQRPVPSNGPILNPSYVPMSENQQQKASNLQTLRIKTKAAPVPLPRTMVSNANIASNNNDQSWPTSQAPILNKIETTSATRSIPRPNSLHLLPPPAQINRPNTQSPINTATTSNSFITNSSVSIGTGYNQLTHCDSGIDPEAGTDENSSEEKTFTEFPVTANISSRSHRYPDGTLRLGTVIPPQLPTNPPLVSAPPLPPKRTNKLIRVVDGSRIPPIPKNIATRKVNRF